MSPKQPAKPKAKPKAKAAKEPKSKKAPSTELPSEELGASAKTVNESDTRPLLGLSSLAPRPGARKVRKRLGIGEGSGNGKTCGKGQKGQTSRSGFRLPAGFEGGQMPIYRRLPKVGFTSRKKTLGVNDFQVIGLDSLVRLVEGGTFHAVKGGELSLDALKTAGLARANRRVKILGGAELKQKLVVEAHAVSVSARAAIEGAGGQIKIVQ